MADKCIHALKDAISMPKDLDIMTEDAPVERPYVLVTRYCMLCREVFLKTKSYIASSHSERLPIEQGEKYPE
jgi:hypothetical protein